MARAMRIIAWVYGALALFVLVVTMLGIRQDPVAAAPAIFLGLPWTPLILRLMDALPLAVKLIGLAVGPAINFGILMGLAALLGRRGRALGRRR